MKKLIVAALVAAVTVPLTARDGMWMPQQIPQLADELRQLGLQIDPNSFADLTGFPMGAIISLGGCSASFVSPEGLAVTNHHCAYGVLQFNSTPERDLIENGFLARSRQEEVPAGPGTRIFVTTKLEDVTTKVRGNISSKLSDVQRNALIERREKELVAECEKPGGVRCRVASFFEGAEYQRITMMEIRDVRLAYAPARGIGEFGGEIDNWMWPRHTGDFAFYRAYVDRNGQPADYSPDNVPFRPLHHLRVATGGVNEGDLVLVAGYPGRTFRYITSDEVENQQEFVYPQTIRYNEALIRILEEASKGDRDAEIRNASRLRSFANVLKNNQGALEGLRKGGLVELRQKQELELMDWIAADPARAKRFGSALEEMRSLRQRTMATRERDAMLLWLLRASPMLTQANTLYRLSLERPKKDIDREAGFQERDMTRLAEGVARAQRLIHVPSDRAALRYFLLETTKLPEGQRIAPIDKLLAATGEQSAERQVDVYLDRLYGGTRISEQPVREAMLKETTAQLTQRNDTFVELAAALMPLRLANEERSRQVAGGMSRVRPLYIEALRTMRGGLLAPDANSTLRVTFGTVQGYRPRDAVIYLPQTDVRGILEKDTGEEPFDSPKALLDALRAGRTEGYVDPQLGHVPVNFLSNVDTTGGNSGSATLNARGELSGLLFDGNYESMASDYLFDPPVTRSIHVDSMFMLWVMDAVDGAHNLLREMGLPVRVPSGTPAGD